MNLFFIKLNGGCMRPLLRDGDIVLVVPWKKKLRVGDIVLYKLNGQLFLHRVVRVFLQNIVVNDDCGITSYVNVQLKNVIGIYPTILSGFLGYIYHILVKSVYITFRLVKKLSQR
ncbi:MAG: S24/S26 family peptidase [Endomicrobiia bacterium]